MKQNCCLIDTFVSVGYLLWNVALSEVASVGEMFGFKSTNPSNSDRLY